jgi:hypothetical protein
VPGGGLPERQPGEVAQVIDGLVEQELGVELLAMRARWRCFKRSMPVAIGRARAYASG